MGTRKLVLEYPVDAINRGRLSNHREVFIPDEFYKACNLHKKVGDAITTIMWKRHASGRGVDQWPPTLEEFMKVAGKEPDKDKSE